MKAVFAGWAAGYLMSAVTTVAATYLFLRVRDHPTAERWLARNVPGALVAVPISLGAVLVWTIVGAAAGAIYELGDMESRAGGLGSPSLGFTVGIVIVGLFPVPVLLALAGRYWWLWGGCWGAFALLFGWLMPILAGR